MTEAAFKKKKNTKASSGERISTHPSYTEYSWDSLVAGKQGTQSTAAASTTAQTRRSTPAQSNAAVRRPLAVSQPVMGRGAVGKTVSGAKTKEQEQSEVRTTAAANVKETAAVKKKVKSVVNIHTITAEKKYAFPMSLVIVALAFTVLIMSIVTTLVQVSEITTENSALQRQYNSLVSEENELRLRLETRDDLRVVEAMAKDELGMVKKDQVERYYLTVHKEDRIEIVEEAPEEKNSIVDNIMSFGGSLVERIRNAFGF